MAAITTEQLHPELRDFGEEARRLEPYLTEADFRRKNKEEDAALRGHWTGKRSRCEFAEIPRPDGSPLRLLVCTPLTPTPGGPGVLWIHGGGYAMGQPEADVAVTEGLLANGASLVVLPDYTRSTDSPYPAALDDCYTALVWLRDHGGEYGVRSDQLFVGGGSAGGGLAAAVTLLARDRGEIALAFQMPLYPMLDDRMDTPSARDNDAPLWCTRSNEAGWRLYLGELYDTDNVPPYAAPARAEDLRGLPPACTFVGDLEPFRDETAIYMRRLEEAGVPVRFRIFEGCCHAFDVALPDSTPAREATAFLLESFRHAAEHYFAPQP